MGARTNLLPRSVHGGVGAALGLVILTAAGGAGAAETGPTAAGGAGAAETGPTAAGGAGAAETGPTASAGLEHAKAGPWSATVKVGPAIEASTRAPTQLALELDLAYALVGDRGYLGIAPQLQLVDDAMIVLPVAFQYDVRLPIADLAVYPRLEAGLALVPAADQAGFAFQPTVGVKWQVHERVHAVLEPLSFPMTFGDPVLVQVRIFAGAGADF